MKKAAGIFITLSTLMLLLAMLTGCDGKSGSGVEGPIDPGSTGKALILEFSQPG